ncbi:MAG: hypothetical protein RBU30_16850 [Polyangia bacterium]|nr:hypothetical protein [Polyangia bacterium]
MFATSFGDFSEGEGLGAAAAYAALGGAGFALALRGFIKWRPWR